MLSSSLFNLTCSLQDGLPWRRYHDMLHLQSQILFQYFAARELEVIKTTIWTQWVKTAVWNIENQKEYV